MAHVLLSNILVKLTDLNFIELPFRSQKKDLELAEGATRVSVGRAIFGERIYLDSYY